MPTVHKQRTKAPRLGTLMNSPFGFRKGNAVEGRLESYQTKLP